MISEDTKKKIKYILGLSFWILAYFIYVLIGGYLISIIEYKHDISLKTQKKTKFLATLIKYNYSINNTKLMEIIESAIDAYNHNVYQSTEEETIISAWSLSTGMFFCCTLVTTIGYGNMYPRTKTGRAFTVIYAILGISITGIVLIKIGSALGKCIEKSDAFWEKQVMKFKKSMSNPKIMVRITQFLITILISLIIIWIIPSIVLVKMEGWDFLTATYFCFITMTTIGLGDVVLGSSGDGGKITTKEMLYQYCSILYILLGLACVTLILKMLDSVVKTCSDKFAHQAEDLLKQASDMISENADLDDLIMEATNGGNRNQIKNTINKGENKGEKYHRTNSLISDSHISTMINNKKKKKNKDINCEDSIVDLRGKFENSSEDNNLTDSPKTLPTTRLTIGRMEELELEKRKNIELENSLKEKIIQNYSSIQARKILNCCCLDKQNINGVK